MINEIFYSIQGEGFLIGTPALFIRFQGCNLRCVWCDEKSALDFDKITKNFEDVIKDIDNILFTHNPNLIVLTGGEPTLNDEFIKVFNFFKSLNKKIQIETNATHLQDDIYNTIRYYSNTHITLSPKYISDYVIDSKYLAFNKNIELKIVVDEHLNEDILQRDYMRYFIERNLLILQPLYSKHGIEFLDKAVKLAEKFNGRVIPQMHKFLGLK